LIRIDEKDDNFLSQNIKFVKGNGKKNRENMNKFVEKLIKDKNAYEKLVEKIQKINSEKQLKLKKENKLKLNSSYF
jgi:hypothetical protein